MSLAAGAYEIQSLVSQNPVVGHNFPLPPSDGIGPVILSEPIHIDGTGNWSITPQGDDETYQLSISGFGYVGVSDNVVTATNDAEENQLWYIQQVGLNEFIIALPDERDYGWTVSGLDPDANIVIDQLPSDVSGEALPNSSYYLFDIHGLPPQ